MGVNTLYAGLVAHPKIKEVDFSNLRLSGGGGAAVIAATSAKWLEITGQIRHGNARKLLFELRAGGYNGSTYTLSYDAASDRLTGVYDQVVVKQKFDVVFVRYKS